MAEPFSLTVQLRLEGVAELMDSEKARERVLPLMKALLSLGGWVSLLALVTGAESGMDRTTCPCVARKAACSREGFGCPCLLTGKAKLFPARSFKRW